jgi:hypothetical protein
VIARNSWGVGRVVTGVDCLLAWAVATATAADVSSASITASNKQRVVVGVDRVMASSSWSVGRVAGVGCCENNIAAM